MKLLAIVVALCCLPAVKAAPSYSVIMIPPSGIKNETVLVSATTIAAYFKSGALLGLSPSQFVTTDNTATEVSGAITNLNGAALSVSSSGQVVASMTQDLSSLGSPSFASIKAGTYGGGAGKLGASGSYGAAVEFAFGDSRVAGDTSIYLQPSTNVGPATVVTVNPGWVHVHPTYTSTSTTTGALVVAGGVGIAKTVVIGQTMHVGGGATVASLSTSNPLNIANFLSVASSFAASGYLAVDNDMTVAGTFSWSSITAGTAAVSGASTLTGLVTASSGINFGDATLNAYDALGSWTPSLSFGGSTTGILYTSRSGSCDRTGALVTCSFTINLSSKGSATGTAKIGGLPYTLSSSATQPIVAISQSNMGLGSLTTVFVSPNGGATDVGLLLCGSNNGFYTVQNTEFTSSTSVSGTIRAFV